MKCVEVDTTTVTTIEISGDDIRSALRLPTDATLRIRVPGGGDWSNTNLNLDEHPIIAAYVTKYTERTPS